MRCWRVFEDGRFFESHIEGIQVNEALTQWAGYDFACSMGDRASYDLFVKRQRSYKEEEDHFLVVLSFGDDIDAVKEVFRVKNAPALLHLVALLAPFAGGMP